MKKIAGLVFLISLFLVSLFSNINALKANTRYLQIVGAKESYAPGESLQILVKILVRPTNTTEEINLMAKLNNAPITLTPVGSDRSIFAYNVASVAAGSYTFTVDAKLGNTILETASLQYYADAVAPVILFEPVSGSMLPTTTPTLTVHKE